MKMKLTVLVFLLLGIHISMRSQTQMSIWDFSVVSGASTTAINASADNLIGTPSLQQFYQTIDDNGKGGTAYTDVNGVAHSAGSAIAWDDIKGSGIDAELVISMNTTGWENIHFRFDYKSESAQTFDLRYSIDNGASWILIIDDKNITADGFNSWSISNNDLSAFSGIDNMPTVKFKISELDNTGNNKFAFDNIEFFGDQIVTLPGHPSIELYSSTTRFLHNNRYSGSASSVINDPTDPSRTKGFDFLIKDSNTPLTNITLSVTSSNLSVVPNTNILSNSINDSIKNIKITPVAVGYSDIQIVVSDGVYNDTYILNYAVSDSAYNATNTVFHTGVADASTSIDVGNNYLLAADDETNALLLYQKDSSGYLQNSFNVGINMGLQEEGDFEASCRKGNRAYWMGSLGNSSSGNLKPSRNKFFATDIMGAGANTNVNYVGSYDIRNDIISWGDAHGYNFTSSAASGMIPKQIDGLNVEGMCLGTNTTTLFIAFRAPLVPISNRTKALICPVTNFENWFNNGAPIGSPNFGTPIELDLGGRGIRSIEQNANGQYLIVAGSYDSTPNAALYEWDGNPTSTPVLLTADLTTLNPEGIVSFPSPFYNGSLVELMCDDGTEILYNDGLENKILNDANNKKFRTVKVPTSGGTLIQCIAPAIASVVLSDQFICRGERTILYVNGNLNSATNWVVYSGNCGTGQLATFSSDSIILNPVANTTYFVRGEGACVSPGLCDTVSVLVNPIPLVSLNLSSIDTQCVNTNAVVLSGGSPGGGVYSGPAVIGASFSPATSGVGNYSLSYIYVDANGCADTASAQMVVEGCIGFGNYVLLNALDAFPNPTCGYITVRNADEHTIWKLQNLLGSIVMSGKVDSKEFIIDMSLFSPGIYYLNVVSMDSNLQLKIVKE